ncbi:hypothetical protein ACVMII_003894 [Bradyrhizobium diazoefficiens]
MGPNRSLPCLGRVGDMGGNVGGSLIDDRAYSAAETFFELAIREHFESLNYLVHVEYGFGGNMGRQWIENQQVIHAGRHPFAAEIHEAILNDRNRYGRPMIGKADFLLIPADGRKTCGVMEVGALRQLSKKHVQVRERVAQLQQTMAVAQRRGKCAGVTWRAEPWRPAWPPGKRASDPFGNYYICAEPTWRVNGGLGAPSGVLLYEVHRLKKDEELQRVPAPASCIQPIAADLLEWLKRQDGQPAITLAFGKPEVKARQAVANGHLRQQLNTAVALYGAAAVATGLAALLLLELGPADAPLIGATYKFAEAAAAAAAL